MRKRYKVKKASCSLCKPHKMGYEDRRTLQWKKQDEAEQVDEKKERQEDREGVTGEV